MPTPPLRVIPALILVAAGFPAPLQAQPPAGNDHLPALLALAEHMRDNLQSHPTWITGTVAIEPRIPCLPGSCPTGWLGTRDQTVTRGIAEPLELATMTISRAYTDAQFLGRPTDAEAARISGVIALGRPTPDGENLSIPVIVWWHRDANRREVYQRESVATVGEGPDGWQVLEVRHLRALLTGG